VIRRLRRRISPALKRARTWVYRTTQKTAELVGFHLVRKHFYSPIPDLRELPPSVWQRESSLPGIHFDPNRQLDYVSSELAGYLAEFRPPAMPAGALVESFWDNDLYQSVDSELLYAMIRCHQPRRVIEIGSGYSTLVSASACDENRHRGHEVELVSNDPFPQAMLPNVGGVSRLVPRGATDIPLEEFSELTAGDVLFIDTTHTVKLGGDVNYLVLEVLPILNSGVIVHIHDIFLPWEYPRSWALERRHWTEQYLVQAFLCFNRAYEILASAQALARHFPGRLSELISSYDGNASPKALWMRRTEAA